MKLTEVEILHTSERGTIKLMTDENGDEYVCKSGRFNADVLRVLTSVQSPYIVKIIDFSETEIVMEHLSGTPLSDIAVPPKQLPELICEICDGFSALHSVGIIHRDIKPSNIMLCDDGHIKIIDFDAARIKKTHADKDTSFIGTDGFAPPEQYGFTQTDERSDIYALGVTIKLLLRENYEKASLRAVAEKCMRFNPEQRYPSATKVKAAIIARRYRAAPISCAVVVIAGTLLALTVAMNQSKAVPAVSIATQASETTTTQSEASSTTSENAISEPIETTAETTTPEPATTATVSDTTEQTTTAELVSETTEQATTETTLAATATDNSTEAVTDQALPAISFLPDGFPALPAGITKIDDSEHVKYITWEKLDKETAESLINSITEWFGDDVKITDLTPQTGRSVQWRCDNADKYSGIITLAWVDTEKFSNFPQMKLSFAEFEQ